MVWVLNSDELPQERDDLAAEQQELNLLYVAITRSRQSLYFVPSRPVFDGVGGIAVLEEVDMDELPNAPETLTSTESSQLDLL